jgi:hypothetical protein
MSGGLFLTLGGPSGNVVFSALEIPQEFGPLGGKQVVVRHEFPGGLITQDDLGAFPLPLTWSGILTGAGAMARAQQIDRMRAQGADVTLAYGPFAWLGKITMFEPKAKHQWLIPYQIAFDPAQDLSGVGVIPGIGQSAEQALATQDMEFDDVVSGDDGLSLPASLSTPAAGLDSAVQQGLLNGNGTVAGIQSSDSAAITAAIASVEAAAAPLIAGQDATQASPALDLVARAAAMGVVIASPTAPVRYLLLINPNLFQLAAQYLGDAGLWQSIANASGLSDPQPIGEFTITIPAT